MSVTFLAMSLHTNVSALCKFVTLILPLVHYFSYYLNVIIVYIIHLAEQAVDCVQRVDV